MASKDELLKEARDRLALCVKAEADDRRESLDDFRFLAGEQWPEDMRRLRQVESRPCLTINKLPAFVHQVVNDQRQNRPSIKVHPVDSGADVDVADVEQGMIRYIEYNSNADVAYDTAISHATIGGKGFFRLKTDYADEKSFDQEIQFLRVQNPFTVYVDPFSTEPDGSDMKFCFVTEVLSRDEFTAQFPNASTTTNADALMVGQGDSGLTWISTDNIRVAEYYVVKTEQAKLCRLETGEDVFEDEAPEGVQVAADPRTGKPMTRMSERRSVHWYKMTAAEVLEETEIPCRWIPVFPVYGDEQIVDGKVRRNGMVRWAKDPQRMYNFWMTSATEEVSLRPKAPFIGAVGQFDTAKKDWKNANNRSFAYLEYDPIDVNGTLAPAPQRQQMADVPTGVLAMAMHASDNIKATTGIFDASLGAQGNETSGRAITARQKEGDTANFHFADNLGRTIRHAGRCIVHMIPRVYDTQRVVKIMGADEKMDTAEVNKPLDQPEQHPETGAIRTVLNDLTVGRYDVTVGAGPSYTTQRAEAVDAMMQAGQAYPTLWQVAGDKIIRAMDWQGADEIADRLERTIPANIKDDPNEKQGAQQLPPQVIEALQHAQQEIQQLQQQLQQAAQEASSGMQAKELDAQVRAHVAGLHQQTAVEVARIGAESRQDVAELTGMVQLLLQRMQPPPELTAAVDDDLSKSEQIEAPSGASSSLG